MPSFPEGSGCRRFSLSEIENATGNFDQANFLGSGGYGEVYEGRFYDGSKETVVAVKRSASNSASAADQFRTERELLSKFKHSNLISLLGYCDESSELILVYEFMPNGSLADHLYKKPNSTLTWEQLVRICMGAARGLDHLHTGTGPTRMVIHCDVKTSNILLDENFNAKISDLGSSKSGPANSEIAVASVRGTRGYMAPEYKKTLKFMYMAPEYDKVQKFITTKVDVYAFGVVLLEVLCGGRGAWSNKVDTNLYQWILRYIKNGTLNEIAHPSFKRDIIPNCLQAFAHIAARCLHDDPNKRFTMSEVVAMLQSALALQEGMYPSISIDDDEFLGGFHRAGENSTENDVDSEIDDAKCHDVSLREFTFDKIQEATDHFNNANLVGEGVSANKGWKNPFRLGREISKSVKANLERALSALEGPHSSSSSSRVHRFPNL